MGTSGRAILKALIAGETDPGRLADLTAGRLKASRAQLIAALHGRVTAHHRFMIELHLTQIEALDAAVRKLEDHLSVTWPGASSFVDISLTLQKTLNYGGRVTESLDTNSPASSGDPPPDLARTTDGRPRDAARVFPRRNIVSALGAGIAATLGLAAWTRTAVSPADDGRRGRMAMVIDLRRCYGCQACTVACKSEHGVTLGSFRSWVTPVVVGTYPTATRTCLPRLCNHCERPACVKVCPVGATTRRGDGIVVIDKEACIGCRYCMGACPYGVRSFAWNHVDDDGLAFPSRAIGVADKCDFCTHRIDQGLVPACVNTCPAGARVVGDLDDPHSDVARLVAANPVQTLLPELGTRPQVFYIGLDQRVAEAAIAAGVRVTPIDAAPAAEARRER